MSHFLGRKGFFLIIIVKIVVKRGWIITFKFKKCLWVFLRFLSFCIICGAWAVFPPNIFRFADLKNSIRCGVVECIVHYVCLSFLAVRQAAVYSLGTLAVDRQEFARLSIDHLADMFNDEIQEVRLDAIRALAPLISHGTLQQDQLYTILTVLDVCFKFSINFVRFICFV